PFSIAASPSARTAGAGAATTGARPSPFERTRVGRPSIGTTVSRGHGSESQSIALVPGPASRSSSRLASAVPRSRTYSKRGAISTSWTASIEQPQIESCGWFCRSIRQRSRSSSRAVPPVSASSGSHRSRRSRSQATFSCLIHTRVELTPRRIGRYRPHAITGRRLPPELAPDRFALVPHPAREDVGVISERAEDLRELRRMAERVGDVRHARGTPELTRAPEPLLKIADDRFAGGEEEVREDMPRPDEEPVGPDERFDPPEVSGAFLEIVLDRGGLSGEGEL